MLKSRKRAAIFSSIAIVASESSYICFAGLFHSKNEKPAVFFCERQSGKESVCEKMCEKINSIGLFLGFFGLLDENMEILTYNTPFILTEIGRAKNVTLEKENFKIVKRNINIIIESAKNLKNSKEFLKMSSEDVSEYGEYIDDSIRELQNGIRDMEYALNLKYNSANVQTNSNSRYFSNTNNNCNIF